MNNSAEVNFILMIYLDEEMEENKNEFQGNNENLWRIIAHWFKYEGVYDAMNPAKIPLQIRELSRPWWLNLKNSHILIELSYESAHIVSFKIILIFQCN